MVAIKLKGGLGNMLFQIAAIETIARDLKVDTYYPNTVHNLRYLDEEKNINPDLKNATEYLGMFRNFDWKVGINGNFHKRVQISFHYNDYHYADDVKYIGFFQSEKWFPDREYILWLFRPSTKVTNEINNCHDDHKNFKIIEKEDSCFVHVRRGERTKQEIAKIHPITTEEYVRNAMEIIGKDKRFIFFSDDIAWCKQVFRDPGYIFINYKDYIDLFLMARCNNAIIAASSFSWWGAWLGSNKNVVTPKIWVLDGRVDTKDINCKNWIEL